MADPKYITLLCTLYRNTKKIVVSARVYCSMNNKIKFSKVCVVCAFEL